jgi:ATP-dependent DNA helicase RecG
MAGFFETKIEFLKGVGPQRANLLNRELKIFTFGDLIQHFPFRYEDRTQIHKIKDLNASMPFVQILGFIRSYEISGRPHKQRLVVHFFDDSGELDLIWFQGAKWITKKLKLGIEYLVFGKPNLFNSKLYIGHPELDIQSDIKDEELFLQPVYPTTEKLKSRYIDSKTISKIQKDLIEKALTHIKESLPEDLIKHYKLMNRSSAYKNIHFPTDQKLLTRAQFRLKFEELFFLQLRLLKLKLARYNKYKGQIFGKTSLLNDFYYKYLPFELTGAQKNVIREIFQDMKSGHQMNRLLQGDVGSGKTIVAFISMLLVIANNAQAVMMAPTEILAEQHFNGLKKYTEDLGLRIALLTGSTKKTLRKKLLEDLENGEIHIMVGTHALIEDKVQFKNLGLAIVDEQHRFGVAQRAKLWKKHVDTFPHVLVMTATPIPRTLAMTLYGDLEVSIIDELPEGRKPVKTFIQFDQNRLKVFGFIREQIQSGRQVYIVYPLIEESEKLDLKHLMDGYESLSRAFPEFQLSIVHGKMKTAAKEYEMKRFVNKETQIMVSTTVIEVGVDVPNASVMVIENAERFGLAQLHQLRGRVGRGADQSYCILMCNNKLSNDAKIRLETMTRTNNGFEIANTDLSLRGPGDLMGTQQSGVLDLLIADIGKDGKILQVAREAAKTILDDDPGLEENKNRNLIEHIKAIRKDVVNWSRIS